MQISEQDRGELQWAERVNKEGIGLYGPTVIRHGPVRELKGLEESGLLKLQYGERVKTGYWITQAGRAALANT